MIDLTYKYFLNPDEDGNMSLPTTESRIADAAHILKSGETIRLDDGKIITSEAMLKQAVNAIKNLRQQKIYFQDEKMTIGSKVWEFVGKDASQASFKRKKTIPVNAISSVDFVYVKTWWCWVLIALGFVSALWAIFIYTGCIDCINFNIFDNPENINYYSPIIAIILLTWGVKAKKSRKNIGKMQVVTNNTLSGYDYDGIYDYEAEKYLEPMRQCLLEKEN